MNISNVNKHNFDLIIKKLQTFYEEKDFLKAEGILLACSNASLDQEGEFLIKKCIDFHYETINLLEIGAVDDYSDLIAGSPSNLHILTHERTI